MTNPGADCSGFLERFGLNFEDFDISDFGHEAREETRELTFTPTIASSKGEMIRPQLSRVRPLTMSLGQRPGFGAIVRAAIHDKRVEVSR